MSRLPHEFDRLFMSADPAGVRALVLQMMAPEGWSQLVKVWKAVQTDLALPAPAIAVNGSDALQLWFSLSEPVGGGRALAFLEGLRLRYLAELPPSRIGLLPGGGAPVPAQQRSNGYWSAFVAPDLAPLFDETPWLDLPPGDEGQASLLAHVQSIKPAMFDAALARLSASATGPLASSSTWTPEADARRFLLSVMNDEAAPLALRVEAAKALLPQGQAR
jgi:hypothetical protein